jgi:hypothetical protein
VVTATFIVANFFEEHEETRHVVHTGTEDGEEYQNSHFAQESHAIRCITTVPLARQLQLYNIFGIKIVKGTS